MEIELSGEQTLAAAFRYMEFRDEREMKKRLSESLTSEILDLSLTPETFLKLPADLQAELSKGLVAGGALAKPKTDFKIQKQEPTIPALPQVNEKPTGILGADGRPISSAAPKITLPASSKFERTAGGLIVPEGTKELPPSAVASRLSWLAIKDRWKKMSAYEKLPHISVNDLPKEVIAVLFKANKLSAKDFQRRSDLPQPIADLMDRLEWVKDALGPLEFRHKVPVNDPTILKKDIETFARMTGIHRFMSDPTKIEEDVYGFSFHVHVSKEGADAKRIGELLNRIRLLELYEQGRHNAAFEAEIDADKYSLQMGYKLRVEQKGLIRVIGDDRIEGRIHTVGYNAEVDRLVKSLGGPTEDTVAELKSNLFKRMADVLRNAESFPTGSTQRREAIQVLLAVNPIFRFPEEMSEDVASAIRGFSYHDFFKDSLQHDIATVRYNDKHPHVVWQKEINAVKKPHGPDQHATPINFISKLASELEKTTSLLNDIPCEKAFELTKQARP